MCSYAGFPFHSSPDEIWDCQSHATDKIVNLRFVRAIFKRTAEINRNQPNMSFVCVKAVQQFECQWILARWWNLEDCFLCVWIVILYIYIYLVMLLGLMRIICSIFSSYTNILHVVNKSICLKNLIYFCFRYEKNREPVSRVAKSHHKYL